MMKAGSIWAGVLSGAIGQLEDTKAMTSGQMNKKEYAVNTTKNITGGVGVMAGIEYGAILGSSLLPGVGTFIGALIGSVVGNRIGKIMLASKSVILYSIISCFLKHYRMRSNQN